MNQEFFVFFSESLPQVINEMLSKLARNKLDGILAEACDAQFKLELNPSSTAEFASSLTFLDEIRERVKPHRLLFLLALLHFYSSGDSDYLLWVFFFPDCSAGGGAGDGVSDVQSD